MLAQPTCTCIYAFHRAAHHVRRNMLVAAVIFPGWLSVTDPFGFGAVPSMNSNPILPLYIQCGCAFCCARVGRSATDSHHPLSQHAPEIAAGSTCAGCGAEKGSVQRQSESRGHGTGTRTALNPMRTTVSASGCAGARESGAPSSRPSSEGL